MSKYGTDTLLFSLLFIFFGGWGGGATTKNRSILIDCNIEFENRFFLKFK